MNPALVLMLPAGALIEQDAEHSKNWRVALFAKITEWIQEYDEVQFVPVIAHYDKDDTD